MAQPSTPVASTATVSFLSTSAPLRTTGQRTDVTLVRGVAEGGEGRGVDAVAAGEEDKSNNNKRKNIN